MSNLKFFLFIFISVPFLVMAAMFVPILGQLLALLNIFLTLALLKLRKSLKLALAGSLALMLFFLLLSQTAQFLGKRSDIPLFVFLTLAIPYNFFYAFMIAREIYRIANPETGIIEN